MSTNHILVSRSYVDSLRERLAIVEERRKAYAGSLTGSSAEVNAARERYFDALADLRPIAQLVVESADERRTSS